MLDREHIIPTPVVENRQPLSTLISNMESSKDDELHLSLDNILSTTEAFTPEQIKTIDKIIVGLHRFHSEVWFYQRVFELALKIYSFCDDWKTRIKMCKIHEKHKFKIHSSSYDALPMGLIDGIIGICQNFMSKKEIVYDRVNILGYCLLELGKRNDGVFYEGADDVFYLVEYVYRRDPRTLLRWARNVKVMNNWSLLYLTNYPDFLYTELKYLNNSAIIRQVIVQQRSHRLCSFLFIKLSILFPKEDLLCILVESYNEANSNHTAEVFLKLFDDSQEDGERILKRFIKKTGARKLSEMFYRYCTKVDGDYVEACLVCIDGISSIERDSLQKLIDSHYWPYLTHRYENFVILMKLLIERGLSPRKEYDFLNGTVGTSPENLKKIQFIATEMPGERGRVAKVLTSFIRRIFKGRMRCNGCHEQQVEASLSTCSIASFVKREGEDERSISGERLLMIYDILDILRDQNIPSKVIYMLSLMNPDLFCTRVVSETRYDCFFIKCMNVVLRQICGPTKWAVEDIARMPLFNHDGFWEVAVRRLLKLKYLWKEISSSPEYENGKVVEAAVLKNNGVRGGKSSLYSLENAVVIYPASNFTLESESSVKEFVEKKTSESLFEDEGKLTYLRLFSDQVKLKYLIKQLEKKGKNYIHLSAIVKQLKISSSVADGMVFKDSSIVLTPSFASFSLQLLLVQYNEKGEQAFVQLENGKQTLKIGRTNGKLFINEMDKNKNDHILLSENGNSGTNISFQSFYRGSKLSFSINGKSYSSKINSVDRIRIGVGFKGIIHKILLCESHMLDRYLLSPSHQSSFYIGELASIERLLIYKNYTGLYMDSTVPYFINGRINVEIRDVLDSRGFYWDYNGRVRELLCDMDKDARLCEIMKNELEDA